MIPMPILMFWVNMTGQPLIVTITPNNAPVITQQAPKPRAAVEEPVGCRRVVCAV